jgi:hypothetical protein
VIDQTSPAPVLVLNDERYFSEAHLVAALAAIYKAGSSQDMVTVAKLCDEHLDRSGRLLGRVRSAAW